MKKIFCFVVVFFSVNAWAGVIEFSRPVSAVYTDLVPPVLSASSQTPISVIVRTGGERWYAIEQTTVGVRPNTRIYVSIDELNQDGGKIISYVLSSAGNTVWERTIQRMIFGPLAPKELYYSIAAVSIERRSDGLLCLIYWTIATSDGYSRHYETSVVAREPFEKVLGRTIMRTIDVVFADERITQFLRRQ